SMASRMEAAIAAAFAILATPAATAETACAFYSRMIAAAPQKFAAFRGPVSPDYPEAFLLTEASPGLGDCNTAEAPDMAVLSCGRLVLLESSARSLYEEVVADAKACLPDWRLTEFGKDGSGATQQVASMRLIHSGDKRIELNVIWARETRGLITAYRVGPV